MLHEWIVRALQGRADPQERHALDEWRRRAPRHERRFRALERLWRATEDASPRIETRPPSAAELLRRGQARRASFPPPPMLAGHRQRRSVGRVVAIAAAAVVLLALGGAALRLLRGTHAGGPRDWTTGTGELTLVHLPDGSVVRLGEDSRLRLLDGDRHVWVSGLAFFAVAKRDGAPFIVESDAGRIRVLGTRFAVRAGTDSLHLAVVEGRVALTGAHTERQVVAGEVSEVARGKEPEPPRTEEAPIAAAWLSGILIFQDTPLEEVAVEVERAFGIPVRVADSALDARTVTAVFRNETAPDVLRTLCRVVDARCELTDSVAVLHAY